MGHTNHWLLALSFVMGLILTLALVIRRVDREVPVHSSGVAAAGAAVAEAPTTKIPTGAEAEPPTTKLPTGAAAAAATAKIPSQAETAKIPVAEPNPYGAHSVRANADGSGPEGWLVKGNEDSMLYHSEESPSYGVTRAEVWFRDVETAEAAGFNRWDSGKSQRGLR
jgi:uncharacterized membrane protein ArfC